MLRFRVTSNLPKPERWHILPLLAIFLLAGNSQMSRAASRPNVVLIFSDDQGWGDVSCYGSEIPTPNIDSLARDGTKLTQWYVASSICTPSRFGLLTGRYPSRSQDRLLGALMSLGEKDASRGIQKNETTFPQLLQKQGYRTALIGKWHLGHGNVGFLPTSHGFDSFYGHTAGCIDFFTMRYGVKPDWYRNEKLIDRTGYATDLITDEAVRFLEDQRQDKPFFLFMPYNAPHYGKGFDPGKQEVTNIMQAKPEDLARVDNIEDPTRRVFAAMVLSLDDGVGRVLSTLKRQGLEENTLVIFMTDHGGDLDYGGSNGPLRGEKNTLFEGGIRVPCLMRWPGKLKPGTTKNFVGSSLDLFPTLSRICGADPKKYQLDGRDISPQLFKDAADTDRELFWELSHSVALRDGPWKYVRTGKGDEFLFNIAKDRDEKKNLAQAEPEIFARLKARHAKLALECRTHNTK